MIGRIDAVCIALAKKLSARERILIADSVPPKIHGKNIVLSNALQDGQELYPLFETYSFDFVLFFPPRGEQDACGERGGFSQWMQVLDACARTATNRVALVSSSVVYAAEDALEDSPSISGTKLSAVLNACADLCPMYRDRHGLQITVLHVPTLFSDNAADEMMRAAIYQLRSRQSFAFPGAPESHADFLHIDDLADFLLRLYDEPQRAAAHPTINLPGPKQFSFAELCDWLHQRYPGARISAAASGAAQASYPVVMERQTARTQFDWQAYITVSSRADALFPALEDARSVRADPPLSQRIIWKSRLLLVVEILLGWGLSEWLYRVASGSLLFGFLDFRLLFVVMIGIVHGLLPGVVAAALASGSYAAFCISQGVGWQTLAFDSTSWLPMTAYFLTATIVGYIKNQWTTRNDEEKQQRDAVEKKYIYLFNLYRQAIQIKDSLKSQIIGYSDGYGRLFRAVQMLNKMLPNDVFRNAVSSMEDFLKNKSIAVYSMGKDEHYARLQMNSSSLANSLKASFDFSEHAGMLRAMQEQRIFCNRAFVKNEPAYCTAIYDKDGIAAVIMIWEASPEQYSIDYTNKILVMTGLVQISIMRALEYERAVADENYLPGTRILTQSSFLEQLTLYKEMQERDMAEFYVLRVCSKLPPTKLDSLVQTSIRQSDRVGLSADGTVCILLAQADKKNVSVVRERLANKGIQCE